MMIKTTILQAIPRARSVSDLIAFVSNAHDAEIQRRTRFTATRNRFARLSVLKKHGLEAEVSDDITDERIS